MEVLEPDELLEVNVVEELEELPELLELLEPPELVMMLVVVVVVGPFLPKGKRWKSGGKNRKTYI